MIYLKINKFNKMNKPQSKSTQAPINLLFPAVAVDTANEKNDEKDWAKDKDEGDHIVAKVTHLEVCRGPAPSSSE